MLRTRKLITCALASLMLAASTIAALAYPAIATGSVNVRTGPGTHYRVIDTLYRGERVSVEECNRRGTWCLVDLGYDEGWVSSSYLRSRGHDDGGYWEEDEEYDDGGYWHDDYADDDEEGYWEY